jgi:DNA repair exonuclease SbcCD ATPase subunit
VALIFNCLIAHTKEDLVMQQNKAVLFMLTSLLCVHNTTHSYVPTPTQRDGLLVAAGAAAATTVGVLVAGYAYSKLRLDHNKLDTTVNAKDDGLIAQLKKLKEEKAEESKKLDVLLGRLAALESANTKEVKKNEENDLFTKVTLRIASANEENIRRINGLQKDLNDMVPKVARLETSEQSSQATLQKLSHFDIKELADKATVDALTTRIGSLDDRCKTLEVQVQGLNKSNSDAVKKAQAEWEALKKDFATARTQVDNYLKNAANIKTQVTNLTDNYKATNATVEGLKKQLQDDHANAAKSALEKTEALQKQLDALEKRVTESAAASTPASAAAAQLSPAAALPASTAQA